MKPVEGFPKCTSANAKFIWNREDSTNGINVPAWKQTMNEADCNYEDCPNYCKENYEGIYVKGVNKNVCYSYEILHEICFVIKYDPLKNRSSLLLEFNWILNKQSRAAFRFIQ